jgi:FtsH-binding integral membrane protein
MDAWSSQPQSQTLEGARAGEFMSSVYRWMAFGLALTGLTAWGVVNSPAVLQSLYVFQNGHIAGQSGLMWIAVIGWFILGIAFTPLAMRASIGAATGAFLVYCALSGVVFSGILLAYTGASVASTLFVTGGAFFGLSLYGTVTKRDLSAWRSFLIMGLIGVFIAMIVNIFLRSAAMEFVLSCCGVLVFAGLTAWDTQKLRALGAQGGEERHALIGALALYLDFVNLFLFLLRFMGRRRD